MADSSLDISEGSGKTIDTRTEATNSNHRQVIVVGDPSVNAAVAEVVSADPGSSSTAYGAVVRLAGSATVQVAGSTGSLSVYISGTSGTLRTHLDPSSVLAGITSSISTYLSGTSGTLQIKTDPSSVLSGITSSVAVYFDRGNPSVSVSNAPTITGITNTIGVHVTGTSGTLQIKTDPSSVLSGITSSISTYLSGTSGTLQVKTDPSSTLAGITSSISVYLGSTSGTLRIKLDESSVLSGITSSIGVFFSGSAPAIKDINKTATAQYLASGSSSAVSTSGLTLASPVSGSVTKVYGYSITTTAQVGLQVQLTDGSGASPTTFLQLALQAPSQGIAGANLAVTPPGYLFATASNTTLSLRLSSASLVHYTVYYFRESA